jgi:hypothetical protein
MPDARFSATRNSTTVMIAPEESAAILDKPKILPARPGFVRRNSATYFVDVSPSPNPAKTPNAPRVLRTIPTSPTLLSRGAAR